MASDEVPVFIDTSLGTHIAISVSPHLTAAGFKNNTMGSLPQKVVLDLISITQILVYVGRFESMHSTCYPGIGSIKVDGLMVKRRYCLYHLPQSMPIKNAFRGSKRTWFLYAVAYPLNEKVSSTPQTEVVHGGLSENRRKRASMAAPLSKTMAANKDTQGSTSPSCMEERMSESISVSGIISKYFSVYDEVTSTSSNSRLPKYEPKTPPATITVGGSKTSGVGKKLVVAANNLGISTSDKKPVISLCKYKCGRTSVFKSSLVRHPVFELFDEG